MIKFFSSRPSLRLVTGLLLIGAIAACAPARRRTDPGPGRYVQQLSEAGLSRSYIVDVPSSYTATKPMPVVIVLHGWTATGALAEKYTNMKDEAESQGFIAVFPDGVGKGWNAGFINLTGAHPDDVGFIGDLLDHLEKQFNVDKNREYVCGHSNGAFMANELGAKLSGRLAAIGSVAGASGTATVSVPAPDSPISVILIHGKQDGMVAYSPNDKALFKGVSGEEAAHWWAQKDGCGPAPSTTTSKDGNVTTELFTGGKGDTEVELVSIANGSHSWPGGWQLNDKGQPVVETSTGVKAADLLWQFFKSHPKTGTVH